MATKKASKAAVPNPLWAWVFVLGFLIAGIVGVVPALQIDIVMWVLLLAAVLSGLLFLDPDDLVNFGIVFLVLSAVAGALGSVPAVGEYITGFFTGVAGFFAPAVLTLFAVWLYRRYIAGMMS
jgi:hypothetical protein